MSLPLRALAPAKLNLCLYVGGLRPDGLHEICSIFQPITLADELLMEAGTTGEDELLCPGVEGPNVAAEALARFRERFGWDGPPLRVTIEKRIPLAAGLAGGSADAAAVLRLALAVSGIEPDPGELSSLATTLGADVPSQLEPGLALVSGAGERIEPLEGPTKLAALLLSGVGELSTGRVYAHAESIGAVRDDLAEVEERVRRAIREAKGDVLALAAVLQNDLEASAIELEPAAAQALALLREAGAFVALLSGSGPAALGLFQTIEEAERARAAIESSWPGTAVVVEAAPPGCATPRSA